MGSKILCVGRRGGGGGDEMRRGGGEEGKEKEGGWRREEGVSHNLPGFARASAQPISAQ